MLWTLAWTCLLAGLSGCKTAPPENLRRFEFTRAQMGLPFRIVLYAPKADDAGAAADAAFARIAQLNDILTDYDADSELSRLSRTAGEGRDVPVSEDLWLVLQRAQEFAARSDGAFDITVGPLTGLWRKARREQRRPPAEQLRAAVSAVGWRNLALDPRRRTARLVAPDMRLDLGGIAKGYALDEALKTLRAHGIRRALVTGGGDMAMSGPPPHEPGWRIQVAPLDISNAPPARVVILAEAALATSGDVFQHAVLDGVRHSHIIDPRTGHPLTDHSLVTVIAREAMTADALATAVSVLGADGGQRLAKRTPGVAVHWVRMPHGVFESGETPNFRRFSAAHEGRGTVSPARSGSGLR